MRVRTLLALLIALSCGCLTGTAVRAQATPPVPALTLKLLVVDPSHSGAVSVRWETNAGLPDGGKPGPGLVFQKSAPTASDTAAVAVVQGIAGWPLTELGFDYDRDAGSCSNRAPRFEVITSDGSLVAFACAGGSHEGVALRWSRVRFGDADAVLVTGSRPWPGFGNVTVQSLALVFDDGPDQGLGRAFLDNIDVDGTWITGPGTTA